MSTSDSDTSLNSCGCCEGLTVATPSEVKNRPGLSAIARRVGDYNAFRESLLALLSCCSGGPLTQLTSRDNTDFTIALLDAFAVMADVLTFYQERIANEGYLRTAAERRSALELARLIGYELRPGVAANAYLAFTLDEHAVSPTQAPIPAGIKVQSIPGPNEKPQTFETVKDIIARVEWNAIKPKLTMQQTIDEKTVAITVKGASTGVKVGDMILYVQSEKTGLTGRVEAVESSNERQTTTITITQIPNTQGSSGSTQSFKPSNTFQFANVQGNVGSIGKAISSDVIKKEIVAKTWTYDDLAAIAIIGKWSIPELQKKISAQRAEIDAADVKKLFVFRKRASLFGYNAPFKMNTQTKHVSYSEWTSADVENANKNYDKIFLDTAYDSVKSDGYVVIQSVDGGTSSTKFYKMTSVKIHPRTAFGISSQTTELTLDGTFPIKDMPIIRASAVHVESEELFLADVPDPTPLKADRIVLDGNGYGEFVAGQWISITGELSDGSLRTKSEVSSIKKVALEEGMTVLILNSALNYSYLRSTVIMNANVAPATHGETVTEVLGSGNAAAPFQTLGLRQKPLTYIGGSVPGGAVSTLQVTVNDVQWREAPFLYGHGSNDHVFVSRVDNDGNTTVKFGDGATGARLPSGSENIKATYRKGAGFEGMVQAGQLSMLISRPLGLKSVTNPLDAIDAQDPEMLDDARRNAPLKMLTMDRVVSLHDYEDFSRAFGGVAKALAIWAWMGQSRGVVVTIAGAAGNPVSKDLVANLAGALKKYGDPFVRLLVQEYDPIPFRLSGTIQVDLEYQSDLVLSAVKSALLDAFSFDARTFGQPVALSEVDAVIQSIPGVLGVDIDKLVRSDGSADDGLTKPLPAKGPAPDAAGALCNAELLTIEKSSLSHLTIKL